LKRADYCRICLGKKRRFKTELIQSQKEKKTPSASQQGADAAS